METTQSKKKPGRKPQWTEAKVEIMCKAIAAGKSYKDAFTAARVGKRRFIRILETMRTLRKGLKGQNGNIKIGTIRNWLLTASVRCWNWSRVTNGMKPQLNPH